MNLVGPILLQFVLIVLNAVFAMAEIAVISISDAKLNKFAEEGDKRAKRLVRLKSDPAKFLATIQVAITLSGFLGSAFAADNFSGYLVDLFYRFLPQSISRELLETLSVILITVLLSYVSLILGELVPKRVAMRKTESIALGLSGTVGGVSKLFKPIVWFLTVSTNGVLRLIGIDPHQDDEEVSEEDILLMADVGAEKGTIDESEREIIENIFDFDDLTVAEIATHRTDVSLLWMDGSDEEWEETIRSTRYTFYPICEESIDRIVGVLDTKDYFRLEDRSRKNILEKAVRTPHFVPEGAKADVAFRNMKAQRASFAVVLDEYAGFKGIVTMKNLIECIVGDIDLEEKSEDEIQKIADDRWRVSGNVTLAVLEKETEVCFSEEYETLSGLVFGLYGAVPEDGSRFSVEQERFSIEVTEVLDHQVVGAVVTVKTHTSQSDENE